MTTLTLYLSSIQTTYFTGHHDGSITKGQKTDLTVPHSRAYKITPQLQMSTSGPAYNLKQRQCIRDKRESAAA